MRFLTAKSCKELQHPATIERMDLVRLKRGLLYSSKVIQWMHTNEGTSETDTTHKRNTLSQKDNHCDSAYIKGQKTESLCTL